MQNQNQQPIENSHNKDLVHDLTKCELQSLYPSGSIVKSKNIDANVTGQEALSLILDHSSLRFTDEGGEDLQHSKQ
jgi:hypothetical protein